MLLPTIVPAEIREQSEAVSYMRGDYYAFPQMGPDDDKQIVLHGQRNDCGCGRHREFPVIAIPLPTFDELVVMRFAELLKEGKVAETVSRVAASGGYDNGGARALANNPSLTS
jgi:hypothetical protein